MTPDDSHGIRGMSAAKAFARRVLPHPVYRVIRRRRVRSRIAAFEPRTHDGHFAGHPLRLRFEDGLAEAWYGQDWPVLAEIALLKRLGYLADGARVFDLGSHQAVVALILAQEVGTGSVLAVEAEPHNVRVARANVALNPGNVELLHAAVSSASGTVRFAEGLNGHIDVSTRVGNVSVRSVTIDELASVYGSPDVVFIDIEGHEGIALLGAQQTLAAKRAAFFVEVHVPDLVDSTSDDVFRHFEGWDRWVAREGDEGEALAFTRANGATLPDRRFFLIAIPPQRCSDAG